MCDLVTFNATIYEHMSKLHDIFQHLRQSNLQIQPDKCEFLGTELAYLGRFITKDGVSTQPFKSQSG